MTVFKGEDFDVVVVSNVQKGTKNNLKKIAKYKDKTLSAYLRSILKKEIEENKHVIERPEID